MVSYLKLKVVKVLNFLYNSTAFLSLRQKTVKSTETVHHRKIRFEVEAEGLILGSFYTFMGCFEHNLCLRAIFCLFSVKSHAAPLKAFNILCLFLTFKCPYLVCHTSLSHLKSTKEKKTEKATQPWFASKTAHF